MTSLPESINYCNLRQIRLIFLVFHTFESKMVENLATWSIIFLNIPSNIIASFWGIRQTLEAQLDNGLHKENVSINCEQKSCNLYLPGKLFVQCEEHGSKCTHVCFEDNSLLCMYCMVRCHKDHKVDPIDDTVHMVKKSLLKKSNDMCTLRILLNKTEVMFHQFLSINVKVDSKDERPYEIET